MRYLAAAGVIVGLMGVGVAATADRSPTGPLSVLPPFEGVTAWLNTSEPITVEYLEGKTTLVVFWTYSNAQVLKVIPRLNEWYQRYRDYGLEVIGIHTPEFPFEESVTHVKTSVDRLGIRFPVAVDSRRVLWAAYRNHEWPAYYVADARGQLLGFQVGAGREHEVELYIRGLLAERGFELPAAVIPSAPSMALSHPPRSPEVVFRLPIGERFISPQAPVFDEPRVYAAPPRMALHGVALDGAWQFEEGRARVIGISGRLVVRYLGEGCFLVVEGPEGRSLPVQLDGRRVPTDLAGLDLRVEAAQSAIQLDYPRAYHVVVHPRGEHTLEITLPRGAAVYACTFS